MTREESRTAYANVAYLCGKAVNGQKPDIDRVKGMDLAQLYHAAGFHMLTAACAIALESAGVKDENFTKAKGRAKRTVALLDREKDLLFARLEAEKIWYTPLKGAVLMDLYPAVGMREMVDIDVLFDPACRERLRSIMEESGYTVKQYGESNHDIYQKPPVYNFEMHTKPFEPFYEPLAAQYYETVESRLQRQDPAGYARFFSDEDFYVFLLAHGYKHYKLGGIGLRFLLDIYVFLQQKGEMLDRAYIEAECIKLDMVEYEKTTRELAQKLYGEIPLSEEETELLDFYFFSGAKGTEKHLFMKEIRENGGGSKGKLRYVFRRVFPRMEAIKQSYPVAYRHKILLPFLPFYRLGRGLRLHRKELKKEIHKLKKISDKR